MSYFMPAKEVALRAFKKKLRMDLKLTRENRRDIKRAISKAIKQGRSSVWLNGANKNWPGHDIETELLSMGYFIERDPAGYHGLENVTIYFGPKQPKITENVAS